jgi:hypothetical protein
VQARRQAWWCVALRIALSAAGVGSVRGVPVCAAAGDLPPAAPPPRKYTPYVDRGQSLPAPYAYGTLGFAANVHTGTPTQAELGLGGGVGLTPRVWIDGSVGTLRVAPSFAFHSAQLGPNVLLLDTPPFELSATVHVSAPADDGRPIEQIEPGLFAVAHFEHVLRLDTGLYLDVNPGPTTTVGLRVPAGFAFQITEHAYAIVNTGVTIASFSDPLVTTAIPAGLTLGWGDRLGRQGGPAVGVLPSISFPELVKPWAKEPFRPGALSCGITFVYVTKY